MKLPNGYGTVMKLSGNRRRPFQVRVTTGFQFDEDRDRHIQNFLTIGYCATRQEGLQMLANYHNNPFDVKASRITFKEVYKKWSEGKFPTISQSNISGYNASYKLCKSLEDKIFRDIRLKDLQYVVDTCGKNYPTLRKLAVLFNQVYDYAMKNELCSKDYSAFVDILKFKDKNPNKLERKRFSKFDIERIWNLSDDSYYQIILMLIYTGVRISELLDLKKENISLSEQYFDVIDSKTENGIRRVPIADKILPFFREWFNSSDCEYVLHTIDNKQFKYRNYYDSYFVPLMENLGLTQTPHCCRHTCISLLAEAKVDQTTIKKIVGHSGAMTLTEKVYTHLDIGELIKAVNAICV